MRSPLLASIGLLVLLSSGVSLLNSCSSAPSSSQVDYAHYPVKSITGSPVGRMEALIQGYKTNFSKLLICIRTNNQSSEISDRELLLESKLAFAMWLEAAGYGESHWRTYFAFESSESCNDDKKYAAVIKIGDYARETPKENLKEVFGDQPVISCSRSDRTSRCAMEGSGIVLGLGSPGYLSYNYRKSSGKWISLMSGEPSFSLMSPLVNWTSIPADLRVNSKISAEVKSELLENYEALISAEEPDFLALVEFGKLMAQREIVGTGDQRFNELVTEFFATRDSSVSKSYTPKQGIFHVLIHEVGHQFGMAHADNPEPEYITGETIGMTQMRPDGKWVTDQSTMAYGLGYFYLTRDDRVGIAAAAKTIESYLKENR